MPTTEFTRLSVAPFDKWTYEDVVREMNAAYDKPTYDTRKAYAVDHDHFQDGDEWVGPGTATTNLTIQQQFAPEDAVGEALSNITNAFAEPQIGIAPIVEPAPGQKVSAEIQSRMDEALTLLNKWWDANKMQELVQGRQRTAAWSSRASLRLWIPWRYLLNTPNGIIIRPTTDIDEALEYIHVSTPYPEACMILVDEGTQDKIAVYLDEEIVYNGTEKTKYKRAEMVYLDPEREHDKDAKTILRIVYSDPNKDPLRAEMVLGGRLLASEMLAISLLTDPVIRTQRQLNLLTTLVTRIAETAAFRERYTKNAKPQGYRLPYEDGATLADGAFLERDEEGRQWQVIPQARTLGANTTTELVGLPQYDERGDAKGNQMPDVVIVDPVDPKPYLEAADSTRRRILRMCSQGHLGGVSNAEASGIAYEQARAVFEKDLNRRRTAEEGMLRDLLMAVLALAEFITNKGGYFTELVRVTVDQHVNAGPRSPDLVRLDLESYEAGVLSQETTMARLGVEDISAETMRISKEAAYVLRLIEKVAAAGTAFDVTSIVEALRSFGAPKELLDVLRPAPEPVVAPTGGDQQT